MNLCFSTNLVHIMRIILLSLLRKIFKKKVKDIDLSKEKFEKEAIQNAFNAFEPRLTTASDSNLKSTEIIYCIIQVSKENIINTSKLQDILSNIISIAHQSRGDIQGFYCNTLPILRDFNADPSVPIVADLPTQNMRTDSFIRIYGCYTAQLEGVSIAYDIQAHFGVPVYASTGGVSYTWTYRRSPYASTGEFIWIGR